MPASEDPGRPDASRVLRPLAVAGSVITALLVVSSVGLLVANGLSVDALADDATGGLVVWTSFGIVGGLVAANRPRNVLGWLLLVVGLGMAANTFGTQYAALGMQTRPGSVPLPELGAGLHLAYVPAVAAIPLILLLFPTGRPLTRRWWFVVVWPVVTGSFLLIAVGVTLLLRGSGWVVTGTGMHELGLPSAVTAMAAVGYFGTMSAFAIGAVGLLVRFRTSRGGERQQLKWLAFAVAAMLITLPFAERSALGWTASMVAMAGVPVTIGLAVVRYRLYEIDRIINRALVYTALTVVLAGVYWGLVLTLQWLFSPFLGGSDLVIAASTLAVVAAFVPVRRRLQRFVDRRFNRSRYDAQRIVDGFSRRLRDELDLDALTGDLCGTVRGTVQPSAVGLWLPGEM